MTLRNRRSWMGLSWGMLLVLAPALVLASSGGPPDEKTGAPGENTCAQCHGSSVGDGSLMVQGVPAEYVPGQTYNLTVTLSDTGQQRWGFELTAINDMGERAGAFTITDPTNTQLSIGTAPDPGYVKQTATGTFNGTPDGPVSWMFDWTAPGEFLDDVSFYLAGNAANGDSGTSGDFVYTDQASSIPSGPTATPTMEPTGQPTPEPTSTPTGDVTPTPTGTVETGVTLTMPSHMFMAGDPCSLDALVVNAGATTLVDHLLFVIMDAGGFYWFAPSWIYMDDGVDYYSQEWPTGETTLPVIPQFPWPGGIGSGSGIMFWGALTDPGVTMAVGTVGFWEFGWM